MSSESQPAESQTFLDGGRPFLGNRSFDDPVFHSFIRMKKKNLKTFFQWKIPITPCRGSLENWRKGLNMWASYGPLTVSSFLRNYKLWVYRDIYQRYEMLFIF